MKEYVLGFAFEPSDWRQDAVLLLEKRRPTWMVGMLNGVGGQIEPGESPAEAMVREFDEEILREDASPPPWQPVCSFGEGQRWRVHVFRALGVPIRGYSARTDELARIVAFGGAIGNRLRLAPHVGWLIPLCLVQELGDPFHVPLRRVEPWMPVR